MNSCCFWFMKKKEIKKVKFEICKQETKTQVEPKKEIKNLQREPSQGNVIEQTETLQDFNFCDLN